MDEGQTFDEITANQNLHAELYDAVVAFDEILADGDWTYRTQGPAEDWWFVVASRSLADDLQVVARMRRRKGDDEKQVTYSIMGRNIDWLPQCEASYRGPDVREGLRTVRSEFWTDELSDAVVEYQARLSALAMEANTQSTWSTT